MRIGFDARMVDHAGIGRYIECLLHELILKGNGHEFILFGDTKRLESLFGGDNVSFVKWNAPIYSLQEQLFCPFDRHDMDLVHIPHFNVPVFCRTKTVVTVHDLIYLLFPAAVPFAAAKLYAGFMTKRAIDRAERVIAVSEHTKRDIARYFGERYNGKIDVVHEAAGKEFRRIEDKGILDRLKEKYGLSGKIVLYVGSVKPHKNVSTLIKVYSRLMDWNMPCQLVIAGRWDKKEDRLKRWIRMEDIKYIGEVPFEDLVCLYSMADLLVHLSLYEGFGLTVLEAMQCGCPVVTSEISSLAEVAGKAALTVDPLDVGQISETVYNVLTSSRFRQNMSEEGFRRAAAFSWERAADETMEAYRKVVLK